VHTLMPSVSCAVSVLPQFIPGGLLSFDFNPKSREIRRYEAEKWCFSNQPHLTDCGDERSI